MKLKLTGRLTAALVAVTLVGLSCAAVIYQIIAGNVFNDLVVAETSGRFTGQISDYYKQHGSLEGINDFFQQQHARQVAQILGVNPASVPQLASASGAPVPPGPANAAGSSAAGDPGGPPGGPNGPPPGQGGAVIAFALADPQGAVVLPGGKFQIGQHVAASELREGVPIRVDGKVIGTALLPGGPLPWSAEQQEYVRRTRIALALAALAGVAISTGVGVVLARGISRPLRMLTDAVRRMRDNEVAAVPVSGPEELADLARGFNEMSADLAKSQQARRQMTADIAHELKNPLTTITGYVQAMRDEELAPTQDRLDAVYRQAQRLGRIVEDLRTLSLAEVGGLSLTIEPLSPAELLRSTVGGYLVTAEQRSIDLSSEVDGDLGDIQGDYERLSQVLGNLVSNALRHTPEGGKVRLTGHAEGAWIVLTVQDTGEGIPADDVPYIFDRLFRAGAPGQRDKSGSGLGLAIVQALVTAHGGTIEVESTVGIGTTFTIRLPQSQVAATSLSAA